MSDTTLTAVNPHHRNLTLGPRKSPLIRSFQGFWDSWEEEEEAKERWNTKRNYVGESVVPVELVADDVLLGVVGTGPLQRHRIGRYVDGAETRRLTRHAVLRLHLNTHSFQLFVHRWRLFFHDFN